MRKYIFTENQIKKVVDNIILEQTMLKESSEIYTIKDLAEMLSRTGLDEPTVLEMLQDVFKSGGDEAIVDLFKVSAEVNLKTIGKGKYVIRMS